MPSLAGLARAAELVSATPFVALELIRSLAGDIISSSARAALMRPPPRRDMSPINTRIGRSFIARKTPY